MSLFQKKIADIFYGCWKGYDQNWAFNSLASLNLVVIIELRLIWAALNLAYHNLADDYFLFKIRNSRIVFFIMIHICTTTFGRTQIVKSEQNWSRLKNICAVLWKHTVEKWVNLTSFAFFSVKVKLTHFFLDKLWRKI